jgi:hypothetical protein
MDTWSEFFEQVVVPLAGLVGIAYAAAGGPVPESLYPVLSGMVAYPVVRAVDKQRRK